MSSEYIVEPAKIESQLNTIWDLLQGKGKTRASLFNLIIYTEKNTRFDYLYKVAQKLIEKFPSRVILITVDDTAPPNTLKTAVSALSSESSQNSIACDFINILLSSDNKERTPFMILPHLLTDLPIYLLWGDDPTKIDPISQKIEKLATRVIFDSESTDDLTAFAKAVLRHKDSSGSDIADLNWARMEGWRQLFAETFKNKDRLLSLRKTTSIKIVYNCLGSKFFCHTKIQSLYLQGWLASQMDWDLKECKKENSDTLLTYTSNKETITITLSPSSIEGAAPGRILEVSLLTKSQEKFHFIRSKKHNQIIDVQYSTPDFCQIASQFIFDRYESGQSLVKEIFHKGTSSHYLSLLLKLSKIDNKALSQ